MFSFKPVYIFSTVFCVLILIAFVITAILQTTKDMKNVAQATLTAAKVQVEYRIDQSIKLLESLAAREEYYDSTLDPLPKVKSLNKMNEYFNYMMICYVDKDMIVYSDGEDPASLASREYMQKLFSTGRLQVTDSFAAGADGKTLNYTVAVPLFENDSVSGCLFCAIYFDEVQTLLTSAARQKGIEATLVGSQNQMMSTTTNLNYGDSYIDFLGNANLSGTTKDTVEADLLSGRTGDYYAIFGVKPRYTCYSNIENTSWAILTTTDFGNIFSSKVLGYLPIALSFAGLLALLVYFIYRYMKSQRNTVNQLVASVQTLERKLYLDEKPDNMDFHEILQLTSDGLSDGLTGVVTRSVFVNQIQGHFKKLNTEKISALCFIDLDDLKLLNDTYGHGAGDIALKSIGYILREYEKKYDGLVGRYGGDEFLLLLTDIQDFDELDKILADLSSRLNFPLKEFGAGINVHCSIGVTLYRDNVSLEQLLSEADKALYVVKQNGKNSYKIHSGGQN